MMFTSWLMPVCVLGAAIAATGASAFVPLQRPVTTTKDSVVALMMGYVPEGMTPEQWKKVQEQERLKSKEKKFGAVGPQSFQSRSMQAFQKDMEKGQTGHLFPVFNAKKLVQEGKIKPQEIPYMQRGGKWDDSDVKGAKKKAWSESDKKYNANAAPTTPSYLGFVERTPSQKAADAAAAAKKTKAAAPKQQKSSPPKAEPKKLFGLF